MWNAGLDASTQFRADQADLVAVSARREALAAHESVQNAQIQRVLQSDATQFVLLQASLAAGGGFAALAAVSPMAALALNSVGTAHGVNSIADGYYSGSKLQFGLGVVEAGLSLFGLGAVTKALGRTETLTAAAWNPEWVNGPQLTRPVAEPEVVPNEANVGGVVVDAETLAARQATANAYYKTLGWDDDRIASHMGGIDFSQPVEVVTLPGGLKGCAVSNSRQSGWRVFRSRWDACGGNWHQLSGAQTHHLCYDRGRLCSPFDGSGYFRKIESSRIGAWNWWRHSILHEQP
ncbi:hypothetical protein ABIE56_002005 [Luteibacter sp. 621]|uniref:hypothetical protein n=1 Tax=Luteibacter sp. 621 TaxID=3373916 RepID=UPI003D1BD3E7